MKITALDLHHISIPFVRPYKLSKRYGTLTDARAVIVKLHTNTGLVGVGEADPMNPFTEETPGTAMSVLCEVIAPQLLGQDPLDLARIEARLDESVSGHWTARGAVNMALYDILGKYHEQPVHRFLGGLRHNRIPLLGPIGSGTVAEDAAAIEALEQQGYRTVMIKMGALPIGAEIDRMIAAFERFGGRLTLIADANQGWHPKEAQAFVDGTRSTPPHLLEQPVASGQISALSRLRRRSTSLLSVDESLVSVADAAALIRAEAADVFSIKVSKNGGLDKSLTIARAAEVFGIRVLMNSMLEFGVTQAASLQLGCTLGNLLDCGHAYMSVLRLADDVTDFRAHITDAVVTVPTRPGLGVSLLEDKLKQYTRAFRRVEA